MCWRIPHRSDRVGEPVFACDKRAPVDAGWGAGDAVFTGVAYFLQHFCRADQDLFRIAASQRTQPAYRSWVDQRHFLSRRGDAGA